jgi:phosphoenolpyruvate synthase/pyruvate phosphate dikinase
MINTSWGLGESIVGGTVIPDTFVVRKSDQAVINSVMADKQNMTISSTGETYAVDVPRFFRSAASGSNHIPE